MAGKNYSEAGIATARVVNRVVNSPSQAYSIFKSTLTVGRPSVFDQDRIKAAANLTEAERLAPTFLSVSSLLNEVLRLSSNTIWAETLRRAEPSEMLDIAKSMKMAPGEVPTPDQVAGMISFANRPLYGFTPVLVLAAVFGMDLYTEGIMQDGSVANGPWNGAIRMAAEHFATKVTTMEELVLRMKELFPAEAVDKQQFSAFNIINRTGVFNNQGQTITCLVINGTQYFFEAYGRALREDAEQGDYGYDFKEVILSQSAKRRRADELAEAKERAAWEARRGRR